MGGMVQNKVAHFLWPMVYLVYTFWCAWKLQLEQLQHCLQRIWEWNWTQC